MDEQQAAEPQEDIQDDGLDWDNINPEEMTFDDVWEGSVAAKQRAEAKKAEKEAPEDDDDAPEEAPAERVKVGREELEIGDGPGQWTQEQVDLLQRYKKEADQQKSSAQSLEAAMDRLSRENATVLQRLEAVEKGRAPEKGKGPSESAEDFGVDFDELDESLGADGALKKALSPLLRRMADLEARAEGVTSTTQQIDRERRMERESAHLYTEFQTSELDPNSIDYEWDYADQGTTPYAYAQMWMAALQRELRQKGVPEDELYSPQTLMGARYFGLYKTLVEVARQSGKGKTQTQGAPPAGPGAPRMRPRSTTSAGTGQPQFDGPTYLSDEDRALIPA